MKVLYLINFAGKGGTERYVEKLMGRQSQCGLCFNLHGPLAEKAAQRGIPLHQLKMSHPLDLRAAKALAQICKQHSYDVIHAQYPRENCIAILSRLFGCRARVVFTAHLNLRQPWYWRILNRIFTPKNHRVITVFSGGVQLLRLNGVHPSKIQVIFNGIDASSLPPRNRQVLEEFGIRDELVITTLTRFSPEKGTEFLCDAICALGRQTDLPFRVLMVGDGELLPAVRDKIRLLGLEDVILLPGFRSDTSRLLAASDIYVNSSQSEAMSFAILEAMAAGLPVVATDVGGNRDLICAGKPSGILAPWGDAAAFAGALHRLLESEPLRRQYGAAARRKAEGDFDQNRLLDAVIQTYQH